MAYSHMMTTSLDQTPVGSNEIVVTWPDFEPDDPETGGLLRQAGLAVRLEPKLGPRTATEVAELVSGAVGAIVSTDPFDRTVFESAPELRVLARVGIGTDSIDLAAATKAGVVVATTPGDNEETTADHTLAMILTSVRRIVENDASVRRGEWARAGSLTPWDLHGKVIGIIGMGRIGRAVSKRLKGFGTRILASDPLLTDRADWEVVELENLLSRSDIVTLHVPLTDTTRGMIGKREIALMRQDAILVNTSRGGVVDESALIRGLQMRHLRAAALDVFESEPPKSPTLLGLSNVTLSPHIAGLSDQSIIAMTRHATRNIIDVLAGRSTQSAVNPEALRRHQEVQPPAGHDPASELKEEELH
jgi:D-3-phosphoglycerate dehydrogenase